MPAVTATITLRVPEELLRRVDARASEAGMSRNAWLVAMLATYSEVHDQERGAVERALDGSQQDAALYGAVSGDAPAGSPAPAEQPLYDEALAEVVAEFPEQPRSLSRVEAFRRATQKR